MKRSEFLKKGAGVAVLAYLAPRSLVELAERVPAAPANFVRVAAPGVGRVGDIIRIASSGEACMVTRVDTDGWWLTRGLGSVSATPGPVAAGDQIMIIAGAVEEGAELPPWSSDRLTPATVTTL